MTTEETKTITIIMSERRPLKIAEANWPVIAEARWYNGQYDFQANTIRKIKVREHADGRRIVYGFQCAGNGGQHIGTRNPSGGFLIAAGAEADETIRALRRVGGILDDDTLADECIADLPAEDIDRGQMMVPSENRQDEIRLPREGAIRMMRTLSEAAASSFCDPKYASDIQSIADELQEVLTK